MSTVNPAINGAKATLANLFKTYRRQILGTYFLFNLENLLALTQPLALGLAINSLLSQTYWGITILAIQHLSHLLISSLRQAYDSRIFTRIYTDLVTQVVVGQRKQDISVSKVVARSALSREFVDFFEHNIPMIVRSLYSIIGSLLMLFYYDSVLVLYCLLLVIPASIVNYFYSQKTYLLNGKLNDQIEKEVIVIEEGVFTNIQDHYRAISKWKIKLSDLGAVNFSLMELFILSLFIASLIRYCHIPNVSTGDIFATFNYVITFVTGLDTVPLLVQQITRLLDIGQRIQLLNDFDPTNSEQ
ncbi:MAG: hypothetical protein HY819_12985 [Acidobacteria bacterium]|nr:hypothetical protein [Acidobacteriota bacterium]